MLAQIAGDQLATTLKQQRKLARERKQAAAERAAAPTAAGEPADPGTAEVEPVAESPQEREERAKATRAAEREAELARRAQAEAFNDRLGAALVSGMSRVKIDARVIGVLLSVCFADSVDALAMRGARYGFPGWVTTTEKAKREYLGHPQAGEKAREYLAGARTPATTPAGPSPCWRWPSTPTRRRSRSATAPSTPSTAPAPRGPPRRARSSTS